MSKRKDPKRKLPEDNDEKHFKVKCLECDFVNQIPLSRFYDGFEGSHICSKCTYDLDLANHVQDD